MTMLTQQAVPPLPGEWPYDQVGRLGPGSMRVTVTQSMAKLNRLLFKHKKLQGLGRSGSGLCRHAMTGSVKWHISMDAKTKNGVELRTEKWGDSEAEAYEEAARQLLVAENCLLLRLLAECEKAPADSMGDREESAQEHPLEKGTVVHAKYTENSYNFKPALVVDVNRDQTCVLKFLDKEDYRNETIPFSRIRSAVSAQREGEGDKLTRDVLSEAIFIRNEISDITKGKLDWFPDPDRERLETAREDVNNIIHSMDSFQKKTEKGGGVKPHPNTYKLISDLTERTASMIDKVKEIYAYLDERWPRPSGKPSRSEVWQERIKE